MQLTITGVGKEAKALKGGKYRGKVATWCIAEQDDRKYGVLGDHADNWQNIKGSTFDMELLDNHEQYPIVQFKDNGNSPSQDTSASTSTQSASNVRPKLTLYEYEVFLSKVMEWAVPQCNGDPRSAEALTVHIGMAYLKGEITDDAEDFGGL